MNNNQPLNEVHPSLYLLNFEELINLTNDLKYNDPQLLIWYLNNEVTIHNVFSEKDYTLKMTKLWVIILNILVKRSIPLSKEALDSSSMIVFGTLNRVLCYCLIKRLTDIGISNLLSLSSEQQDFLKELFYKGFSNAPTMYKEFFNSLSESQQIFYLSILVDLEIDCNNLKYTLIHRKLML